MLGERRHRGRPVDSGIVSDSSLSAYSGAASSAAELSGPAPITGAGGSPSGNASGGAAHISRADVAHLARLARLAVTDDELDLFAAQLDVILGSVARVGEVTAGDGPDAVEPMTHAVPMTNVYRPDVVAESLPREDVLAGAPAVEDDKFRVPRILAEEV